MNIKEVRKFLLKSFIGFLILTAAVAIISVFSGEIGETQAKILGTSLTISIASICSMSCAAFLEKRNFKPAGIAGIAGIVLSVMSAVLIIIEIWAEIPGNLFFEITATVVVGAFTFAHCLLLFLPKLDENKKWIQTTMAVTDAILALQIIALIWFDVFDHSLYYRIMTMIAIIVGLETLVIPILMKLRRGEEDKKETLYLEKVEEAIYKDATGKLYEVREKQSF